MSIHKGDLQRLGTADFNRDLKRLRLALGQVGTPAVMRLGYWYVPLTEWWSAGNFDGDAFSSVGTPTLIDVSSEYASAPDNTCHIRAYAIRLTVRDSDTWGNGEYWFGVGPDSGTYQNEVIAFCHGGDLRVANNGIVTANSDGDFYYECSASGAGTLDVWLRIIGYFL